MLIVQPDKNNEVIIGTDTDNLHVVKLVPNIIIIIYTNAKDSPQIQMLIIDMTYSSKNSIH